MSQIIEEVVQKIETQQAGKENTAPWMVGEQLKEICRAEPASAEILLQDLDVPEMSIQEAEEKIKAWADEHKQGCFACVTPRVAEDILREFYGLPARRTEATKPRPAQNRVLDLGDFL